MSVGFGGQPERPTRGRLSALRDREVVRAAVAGLIVGLGGGFFGFWVASSRGLDSMNLGNLIAAAAVLVGIGAIALAAARALSHDDFRFAAALVTAVVGTMLGSNVAFAVLAGNTTDGTLELAVGRVEQGGSVAPPVPQAATCAWDRARGLVEAVASRRQLVAAPHLAVTVHVDIPADGPASVTIEALAPVSFIPVARLTGRGARNLADPTGRIGQLTATDLEQEQLAAEDVDPAIVEFVLGELERRGATQVIVSWECPQLP